MNRLLSRKLSLPHKHSASVSTVNIAQYNEVSGVMGCQILQRLTSMLVVFLDSNEGESCSETFFDEVMIYLAHKGTTVTKAQL